MPVIVHWPWYKVLYPFLPALILVPFLLLKSNRTPGAWLVLAPLAALAAVMILGERIPVSQVGQAFSFMNPYVVALASSLCIVLLMAHGASARSAFARHLVIPGFFIVPGVIILLLVRGMKQPQDAVMLAVYGGVLAILILSFRLAGRSCRKAWRIGRFALFGFIWMWVLALLLMAVALAIAIASAPASPSVGLNLLIPFFILPSAAAVLAYLIVLPFLVTALLDSLLGARLLAAFGAAQSPAASIAPPEVTTRS